MDDMKITEYNPLRGYGGIKKKMGVSSSSSNFADILSAAQSAADGVGDVAAASASASVAGLFALQEVSEEEYNRKKTIQHGHTLLDSLEALRHALLMGQVPVEVLKTLEARLKQQRALTFDPALHEIMDDIELRAAVELAKWEMRG
jgi:hypothetical protein